MSGSMVVLAVLGGGGLLLCIVLVLIYNGLINRKNRVANAFGSVDTLLKKRFDLVPNLVSAVKTYMKHEASVLTEITEIRAKATSGKLSDDEKMEMDTKLTRAIGGLMVAVENYPDLKASSNFLQLQASLNEVEEQISAARRAFNAAVLDYNNGIEMFPSNIMASMMRYQRKAFFEISEQERQNVNVGAMFGA